jgi:hypothetical protein
MLWMFIVLVAIVYTVSLRRPGTPLTACLPRVASWSAFPLD